MAIFVMGIHYSFAQTTPGNVEQFCQVIARPRLLSSKVTIDMDYGGVKKFWNDTRLRDSQGNVRVFNTVVDAINYMVKEGWTFVNAYPVRTYSVEIFHIAFKRVVPKDESR